MSLLIAMRDFALKGQIIENSIAGNSKGGIYECAIADILIKKDYNIFFHKNETSKKEIDFLIQNDGKIIPIEVKSSNNRSLSLNQLMNKNTDIEAAYKFIDGNVGISDNRIISLPLYMAMFL